MSSEADNEQASTDSAYPDVLTTHNYDGIQEYDNPMPGWWKALFVGTIVWSVIYLIALQQGWIDGYFEDLDEGMQELATLRGSAAEDTPEVDKEYLLAAVDDSARVEKGLQVYKTNCAACHGQKGEGLVGPNLADKFWIHGGEITAIYNTIKDGVPAKGMPEWGSVLQPEDQVAVTAWIRSIHGTEPEGAKEPEGEPYEL